MTHDIHGQVRELIATGEAETLSPARQTWLRAHLRECPGCRDYAANLDLVTSAIRSAPLTGDAALVRVTQQRVHARARELRQAKERNRIIFLSCLFVIVSSAVTTPFCWKFAQWIGAWAGMPNLVWQSGFAFFWIAPVLAAGALLMARGTHWTSPELEP